MQLAHISLGGPDRKIQLADGNTILFEDHPIFGPIVLNKNGTVKENQPNSKSPFWKAHMLWVRQGKRIGEDCCCIWDQPPPLKVIHIAGKHYRRARPDEMHMAIDFYDDDF